MPKHYAPILPAPDRHPDVDPAPEENIKRRRTGTTIACNACRLRKIRCNEARPACTPCAKRGTPCVYPAKREAHEELTATLNLLTTLPEGQAVEALRTLRRGASSSTALAIATGGGGGGGGGRGRSRPSSGPEGLPESLGWSTSALECELMAAYPATYPDLVSIRPDQLEESQLVGGPPGPVRSCLAAGGKAQPSLSLSRYDSVSTGQGSSQSGFGDGAESSTQASSQPSSHPAHLTTARTTRPQLCDSRLEKVQIGHWTNVAIADDYAAHMISLYLVTDHPLLGTFDPDLFLSDLISHQETFCSRFLVNALLYWACMYSGIDRQAQTYAPSLSTEAEALWVEARKVDSITTMAGAQLLSLAYLGHGRDHDMVNFSVHGCQMGVRLGLFGVDQATAAICHRNMEPNLRRGRCFAAWGCFNWTILAALFYRQTGFEFPKHPPYLPIPGDSRSARARAHKRTADGGTDAGDGRDDPSESTLPSYMGATLTHLCGFWRILHGFTSELDSSATPIQSRFGLAVAGHKFHEILAWAETLPPCLLRADDRPHHVVVFHMWIHSAILDILRPFLNQSLPLKTFSARDSTVDAAFNASVKQLEALVFTYRSRYQATTHTLLWHTALLYVANAVLQDISSPSWHLWFTLCIHGYEHLRRSYRIAEAIGRCLLSMALRDGAMTAFEARQLLASLGTHRGIDTVDGKGDLEGVIRATFSADLTLADTDPVAAKVENLAERFEELALVQEYTNQFDDMMDAYGDGDGEDEDDDDEHDDAGDARR